MEVPKILENLHVPFSSIKKQRKNDKNRIFFNVSRTTLCTTYIRVYPKCRLIKRNPPESSSSYSSEARINTPFPAARLNLLSTLVLSTPPPKKIAHFLCSSQSSSFNLAHAIKSLQRTATASGETAARVSHAPEYRGCFIRGARLYEY